MLENFIYAKKKSLFTTELDAGNILDEAIVFIEDTKEIWNHGTYFDGSTVDLTDIETSITNILNNISSIEEEIKTTSTTTTSIASLPISYDLVVATISASESFSLSSTPSAGKEINVIIKNSSATDLSVTLPTMPPYITISSNVLVIPANGYAEINVVSDGTNIYLNQHAEKELVTPTSDVISVIFDDGDTGTLLIGEGDNSWIKGRRCLAKPQSDGSVSICYLDENNSELYYDGVTPADLSGAQGQWMTDIPEYWYYMDESTEGIHKLFISPTEVEGWKHSRRVLVGVTEAVSVADSTTTTGYKLWSRKTASGETSTGNLTTQQFYDRACDIGDGWGIIDYETHCKIGHLFYAKYLNKNCQTVIGRGQDSYTRTIGTTSTLGNNDGTTDTQISFLGIEDAWGCKWERMAGVNRNGSTVYIYDGYQPDQIPTVEYRTIICPSLSYGCITKMVWGEYGDMIPAEYVSDSNYSQGYFDYGNSDSSGWCVAYRSCSVADLGGGVACLYLSGNPSYYNASYGSRIQYRGAINTVQEITNFETL